ncbi:hypothetical protein C8R44DRAFT_988316 [Mycena epipterygia]|nr:hypothetical protein C8R44DRAFT_988316 [Mycena epipterygia]
MSPPRSLTLHGIRHPTDYLFVFKCRAGPPIVLFTRVPGASKAFRRKTRSDSGIATWNLELCSRTRRLNGFPEAPYRTDIRIPHLEFRTLTFRSSRDPHVVAHRALPCLRLAHPSPYLLCANAEPISFQSQANALALVGRDSARVSSRAHPDTSHPHPDTSHPHPDTTHPLPPPYARSCRHPMLAPASPSPLPPLSAPSTSPTVLHAARLLFILLEGVHRRHVTADMTGALAACFPRVSPAFPYLAREFGRVLIASTSATTHAAKLRCAKRRAPMLFLSYIAKPARRPEDPSAFTPQRTPSLPAPPARAARVGCIGVWCRMQCKTYDLRGGGRAWCGGGNVYDVYGEDGEARRHAADGELSFPIHSLPHPLRRSQPIYTPPGAHLNPRRSSYAADGSCPRKEIGILTHRHRESAYRRHTPNAFRSSQDPPCDVYGSHARCARILERMTSQGGEALSFSRARIPHSRPPSHRRPHTLARIAVPIHRQAPLLASSPSLRVSFCCFEGHTLHVTPKSPLCFSRLRPTATHALPAFPRFLLEGLEGSAFPYLAGSSSGDSCRTADTRLAHALPSYSAARIGTPVAGKTVGKEEGGSAATSTLYVSILLHLPPVPAPCFTSPHLPPVHAPIPHDAPSLPFMSALSSLIAPALLLLILPILPYPSASTSADLLGA